MLQLNELALAQMPDGTAWQLAVVPGASHLFKEPGTLDLAANLAVDWFSTYLGNEEL